MMDVSLCLKFWGCLTWALEFQMGHRRFVIHGYLLRLDLDKPEEDDKEALHNPCRAPSKMLLDLLFTGCA